MKIKSNFYLEKDNTNLFKLKFRKIKLSLNSVIPNHKHPQWLVDFSVREIIYKNNLSIMQFKLIIYKNNCRKLKVMN